MSQYAFLVKPIELVENYTVNIDKGLYIELEEEIFSNSQINDININEGIIFDSALEYIQFLEENGYLKNNLEENGSSN